MPSEEILDVVVENDLDHRQAEHGDAAYARLLLHRVHGDFDGCRDETLDFFGGTAIPLSHDDDLGIGHVGKSLDGHIPKSHKASYGQHTHPKESEWLVFKRKGDDASYEFVH